MLWNGNRIEVKAPARPKKCTGTRFGAVLGVNKWSTPFNAWCAITRTYEEPYSDTIYTLAGKAIEPKQAEWVKDTICWIDDSTVLSPTDKYGDDYFNKTYGDFFPENKIFGGMWDYLLLDKDRKISAVLEMKTTKRAEDWVDDIPEYYALQAALYAYLLGTDRVIMVCTILEDKDYKEPEKFVVTGDNTFTKEFLVSERYPDFEDNIAYVQKWWQDHVLTGISPDFDEKADADILKELRKTRVDDCNTDKLVAELETLEGEIADIEAGYADKVARVKAIKEELKARLQSEIGIGQNKAEVTGEKFVWTLSRTVSKKIDEKAMKKDGVLDKYKTLETTTYRLTNAKIKED